MDKEIEELKAVINSTNGALKEYAYKIEINMVYCQPANGEKADSAREEKCRELIVSKNNVLERINKLMGWFQSLPQKKEFVANVPAKTAASDLNPPCPSQEEMERMKAVRYFNRKIYQKWMDCVLQQM